MATKVTTGLITDNAITDAKIANVAITGVTASGGDSSTALATTAFVAGEINSLIDAAPGALNTLNELAAALGDDASFSTTVTNSIATKMPLTGGTFTGTVTIGGSGSEDRSIVFGLDGRGSAFTGQNAAHIFCGQGSSGDFLAGALYLQSRSNSVNREIAFITGTTPTKKLVIAGGGNVGIGTDSPNAFLSVRKDNNNSGNQFVVADTEGATPGIRTYTHSGDDSGLILNHYYAVGGSGNEYMRYADFVANVGNGAGTTMRFITKNAANTFSVGLAQDNNGNVGIGETSPDRLFHVKRSDSGGTVAKFENSAGTVYVELNTNNQAAADSGYISYDSSMNLGLWTDDQQRVTIDSAGNAAIADGDLEFSASTGNHTISVADYTGDAYIVGDRGNIEIKASSSPNSGGQAKSGGRVLLTAGNSYNGQSGDIALSTGSNHLNASDNGKIRFNIGGTASGDEAMRIHSNGNVGIGTNSPSVNLHVKETASNSYGYLRLEGANRGGWIQMFDGSNAVSNILTDQSGNMYFDTASGYGGNNPTTRMTIEAGGNIHVEATSSGSEFKVDSTGAGGNDVGLSTKLPGYTHSLYSNFFSSGNNIYFVLGGSYVGYIASNGTYNVSDERLKKNVVDLTGSLDKIKQLRGVNFQWIDEERGTGNNVGFIAQEVEPIIPEVVDDGGLPNTLDGEAPMKNVDYSHIVPHLVEAIKEQQTIIEDLKSRIETLEG